jgi:hypothetical protein
MRTAEPRPVFITLRLSQREKGQLANLVEHYGDDSMAQTLRRLLRHAARVDQAQPRSSGVHAPAQELP